MALAGVQRLTRSLPTAPRLHSLTHSLTHFFPHKPPPSRPAATRGQVTLTRSPRCLPQLHGPTVWARSWRWRCSAASPPVDQRRRTTRRALSRARQWEGQTIGQRREARGEGTAPSPPSPRAPHRWPFASRPPTRARRARSSPSSCGLDGQSTHRVGCPGAPPGARSVGPAGAHGCCRSAHGGRERSG